LLGLGTKPTIAREAALRENVALLHPKGRLLAFQTNSSGSVEHELSL